MSKRFAAIMAALLAVMLVVSACASKETKTPDTGTQTPAPAKEGVFYGAWPYEVPPKTHFNFYASVGHLGMAGSPYNEIMYNPLAMYYWATDKYEPFLATEWKVDNAANTITVSLRKGVKWSDGSDFKAADVVNSMALEKSRSATVWRYVDKVTAKDDHTVEFHLGQPASIALRYVLKMQPQPTSVYGEWAKKFQALYDAGKDAASDDVKNLRKEMDTFRPADYVVTGPYKVDKDTITEAQMTMKKVPTAWAAGQVKFDKIVLYQGETAAITPLVLDKKIDFATHAFPPATEKQILDQGIRVIRYPFYTGPGLFFNNSVYPLNLPEVRQAIAYAINRDENGMVALSKSGVGVKYMAGISDNLLKTWVKEDAIAKLNQYKFDTAKAEELLKKLKFTKGADGIWVDDKGKKLEFEILVPSDFADWSASAENAAQQLTKFGIKAVVRGVPSAQQPNDIHAGKFQIGYRGWGSSIPHPQSGFIADIVTYNEGGQKNNKEKPGQNWPMKQKWSGGEIDFDKLITDSGAGLDVAKQKEVITQLALAFNELLPVVPMFERYSNSPSLENTHVTGWPKDGDPILANGGSDSFVAIMIVKGQLSPSGK